MRHAMVDAEMLAYRSSSQISMAQGTKHYLAEDAQETAPGKARDKYQAIIARWRYCVMRADRRRMEAPSSPMITVKATIIT